MLSQIVKLLFVLTSLSPILFVFAACDFDKYNSCVLPIILTVIALALVIACYIVIYNIAPQAAKEPIHIIAITSTDKETLAYMIAYLLPVVSNGTIDLRNNSFVSIIVMVILILCVFHTNTFHFNPLIGLFGYHFYEIKTTAGNTGMLLSNKTHRIQKQTLNVRELWNFVYIDAGDNEYEEVLRYDNWNDKTRIDD